MEKKKEESRCLNWENRYIEWVQQKWGMGKWQTHQRYQIWISANKSNIFAFSFSLHKLIAWFLCKSGVESVSGWGGRQENAKKREEKEYMNYRWLFNSSPSADTEAYIHHFSSITSIFFSYRFLNKYMYTDQLE